MYLAYYNLISKPFEISPDPKFLWLGEKFKEALAAMKYGILTNKGFLSLTGDAGTGKTTLVNALVKSFRHGVVFAHIPDPHLEKLDFFNFAANAFGMKEEFQTKGDFLVSFGKFLNKAVADNKNVVLIIEESQRLSHELLEEVRLLSNIKIFNHKLINILFVGQNEFCDNLQENRALNQRITVRCCLGPLTESETAEYVMHRLAVAGSKSGIFTAGAIREVYSFTEGNPRLINIVCDLALLSGYVEDTKIIESAMIRECTASLLIPHEKQVEVAERSTSYPTAIAEPADRKELNNCESPYWGTVGKAAPKPIKHRADLIASITTLILLCVFGYIYYIGGRFPSEMDFKAFLGSENRQPAQKPGHPQAPASQFNDIAEQHERIAELQAQLSDLRTRKAAAESQLDELRSQNAALVADLKKLQSTEARIAELESALAARDQRLLESEKKLTELQSSLEREKTSRDQESAALSSKDALVAELQSKLEAVQSDYLKVKEENEKGKNEIAELQAQLSDLRSQKAAAENQLEELRSRNAALVEDLKKPQSTEARIAELESALAARDQRLLESEKKLTELQSSLEREKTSRDQESAALSSKDALVAELQSKLEAVQSDYLKVKEENEKGKNEIAELQAQLSDLRSQKAAAENQLEELRSRDAALVADVKKLQSTEARIVELESALAARNQRLSESEKKLTELQGSLEQEKTSSQQLSAELSSKDALVAELQKQLQTARSDYLNVRDEIEKSRDQIAELQARLADLKAQQAAARTSSAAVEQQTKQTAQKDGVEEQVESPDPSDLIDWLMKKKGQ